MEIWEKVATDIKGPVKLAYMDVTNNTKLARRFNVFKTPAMKFLLMQASEKTNGLHYKGQWTYEAIRHWAIQIHPEYDVNTMTVEHRH